MTASVLNVCISETKGVQKKPVQAVNVIEGFGIEGDAHGGDWHRQVSLLADESAEKMRHLGAEVGPGDFAENLLTRGIDLHVLPIGSQIRVGDVLLEVTQIGKECHTRCAIYKVAGNCIMPTHGIFCKVLRGGTITPGMPIEVTSK
ncbi:MAG: MOSC domain-containing protein [Myxococcota bacterium]|nr:MOSC domain-containing protein [Myxococcota bacterium]